MSSSKSFRMLALASEAWACWHEEPPHPGKEEACHRHRGHQVQERSLRRACEVGKMTRAKHPSKTIMTTTRPFELLHMDLFGPTHYSTLTTTACLYGFLIVDDYSRYTWVHIILYKTEVQDVFRRFTN